MGDFNGIKLIVPLRGFYMDLSGMEEFLSMRGIRFESLVDYAVGAWLTSKNSLAACQYTTMVNLIRGVQGLDNINSEHKSRFGDALMEFVLEDLSTRGFSLDDLKLTHCIYEICMSIYDFIDPMFRRSGLDSQKIDNRCFLGWLGNDVVIGITVGKRG